MSDSINGEAILRLNNLLRRETVRHLHFEGTGDLGLDIDPILCDHVRFPVLESLVFNGVGPVYYTHLNKGVRNLRNFIVRNTTLQGTPTVLLMFSRPSLSYILFQGTYSEDLQATMRGTEGLTAHHQHMATLDIRAPASHPNEPNTRLVYFNGETIQAAEFRENFPLQRARMTYRIQGVTLVVNGQSRLFPWQTLFPYLYPDFLNMRGLMQMIALRSTEDRVQALERHLHGSRRHYLGTTLVIDLSLTESRDLWRQAIEGREPITFSPTLPLNPRILFPQERVPQQVAITVPQRQRNALENHNREKKKQEETKSSVSRGKENRSQKKPVLKLTLPPQENIGLSTLVQRLSNGVRQQQQTAKGLTKQKRFF